MSDSRTSRQEEFKHFVEEFGGRLSTETSAPGYRVSDVTHPGLRTPIRQQLLTNLCAKP